MHLIKVRIKQDQSTVGDRNALGHSEDGDTVVGFIQSYRKRQQWTE